MKVLQLINNLEAGGAEKLLKDAIPKYIATGIPMELLLLDGTEYPFLKEFREKNGCPVHSISTGSLYNPFYIFKIVKFYKSYDIVHVHLFPALYFAAFAKMISFSKVTLVCTEHNTSNRRRKHFIFRILDKLVYGKYKRIITISENVDSEIRAHLNFTSEKFKLIPNGVDLQLIRRAEPAIAADFGISESEYIILQVASFTPQKDQETLLRSIPHVKTNCRVLLVGEGPLIQKHKEFAARLQIEDKVSFLGTRMDVPQLLKMAHLVVLSTHFEGLSLSSIEGLASGKPFLASNAPGLSNIVVGAGILFPIGDEKILAHEIDELLSNSDYYDEIATKCLERSKQFDMDVMIQSHVELYKEVLD